MSTLGAQAKQRRLNSWARDVRSHRILHLGPQDGARTAALRELQDPARGSEVN
jgi:hypothetical protein